MREVTRGFVCLKKLGLYSVGNWEPLKDFGKAETQSNLHLVGIAYFKHEI